MDYWEDVCYHILISYLDRKPLPAPQSTLQVTFPEGRVLCGWGKAKFREVSNEKPLDGDNEILFDVNADTLGVLDGKFGSMSTFLDGAKATKPNLVKICYPKCAGQPDGSWMMEKGFSLWINFETMKFAKNLFGGRIRILYKS